MPIQCRRARSANRLVVLVGGRPSVRGSLAPRVVL